MVASESLADIPGCSLVRGFAVASESLEDIPGCCLGTVSAEVDPLQVDPAEAGTVLEPPGCSLVASSLVADQLWVDLD